MFCKHGQRHVKHVWKQFVSEAELVCPQSCFLLKRLHGCCPNFRPLALPPRAAAGPRKEEVQILGQKHRMDLRGSGGAPTSPSLGNRPGRPSSESSPVSKLSRESECTCVFSAVRSKNRVPWSQAQTCCWQPQAKGGSLEMGGELQEWTEK